MRSSGFVEEIDDTIILEALDEKKEWKFPNTSQCPFEKCRREFGYRLDTINHFKQKHTKNAYFCSECDICIAVYRQEDLLDHNRRLHRDEDTPSEFGTSASCSKSLSSSAENV